VKSLIQWTEIEDDSGGPTVECAYFGTVKGKMWPVVYEAFKGWHWTIRDTHLNVNYFTGVQGFKNINKVKGLAVRWAIIGLLYKIDKNMFRRLTKNENYTVCGL